ncbi:MAG: seg [Microgenomates group bacterium GW2011_GWC1_41_20]|nr:MAG: seg [Microgenomates group bacterium GW2011_GWC1_41_20]
MDPNTPVPQVGNMPTQVDPQLPVSPPVTPAAVPPQPVEPMTPPPSTDQPPAPVAPPPVEPSPEPVKKNSPVFVIALTLLLVAILALGGYVLWTKNFSGLGIKPTPSPVVPVTATPTPDPTISWQSFTDQESRFTFKYPANWTQVENSVVSDITPTLPSYRDSGSDYYVISTEFNDTDFNSWMQQSGVSNFTSAVLNGYQMHSSYDIPGQTPGYEVFIEFNNKIAGLNLFPYDRKYPDTKIIEIYNQILSTFKFIEASAAASPASSPSATVKP